MNQIKSLKKIYFFLPENYRKKLLVIISLMVFSAFLEILGIGLIFPTLKLVVSQNSGLDFIDNFFLSKNYKEAEIIKYILFIFVTLYGFKNLFLLFSNWYQSKFIQNLNTDIASNIFKGYLEMPLSYYNKNDIPTFIRNVQNETRAFVFFILVPLLTIILDLILISLIVITLIYFNPIPSISIILTFTFISIIMYFLNKKKIIKNSFLRLEISKKSIQYMREGFDAIREIKIYSLGNFFKKRFENEIKKNINLNIYQSILSSYPKLLFEFLIVIFFSFFIILFNSNNNDLSLLLPSLGLFLAAAYKFLPSLNKILISYQQIKSHIPSFYALEEVFLNFKEHNKTKKDLKKIENFDSLELKNIFFKHYSEKKWTLENLNFKILKNEIVGIKGSSGAGKSTLLDIITGIKSAEKGKILINNICPKENFLDYENLIGYVTQSAYILDNDIITNISLDDSIDNQKIVKIKNIMEIVELGDFMSDEYLYGKKKIGERGLKISGGQAQRISIARALYRDPKLLILDEATNALNPEIEFKIFKNIIQKFKDISIIIVSHNDNTLSGCDKICDLKNKSLN